MNVLIKHAKVYDPTSAYHGRNVDLLIERGEITSIKSTIKPEKQIRTVEAEGLMVSPGWLDMQANFGDPGFEQREDLQSGLNAAMAGGFTGVCISSGTNPPLHNKAQIDYLINRSKDHMVDVFPVGTISHDQDGKDLAEMYDMKLAGAVAFSDYKNPIKDAGLVLRALQYSLNINSFIITHANDKSISHGGQMNEGVTSTRIGLKGIPALAEEIMIQRNLAILEYTGGKLHFPTISTKGSIDLIKKAKSAGLNVTCGVTAHHLLLDDTVLEGFDSNYKVNPPLRGKEDVEALRKALANGIIDVVVSDHAPLEIEAKDLEFDLASSGILGLQTAFSTAYTGMAKYGVDKLVESLAINPRIILCQTIPTIQEGEMANLTLFSVQEKFTLEEKAILSRSKNTPFIGKTLQGRVVGAINKDRLHLN